MFNYSKYLKEIQAGNLSVNPFLQFLGMSLEELKDGYARFRIPVRPEFIQCAGMYYAGGLLVAMADEALAHAIMPLLKHSEDIVTVEIKKISYPRLNKEP